MVFFFYFILHANPSKPLNRSAFDGYPFIFFIDQTAFIRPVTYIPNFFLTLVYGGFNQTRVVSGITLDLRHVGRFEIQFFDELVQYHIDDRAVIDFYAPFLEFRFF